MINNRDWPWDLLLGYIIRDFRFQPPFIPFPITISPKWGIKTIRTRPIINRIKISKNDNFRKLIKAMKIPLAPMESLGSSEVTEKHQNVWKWLVKYNPVLYPSLKLWIKNGVLSELLNLCSDCFGIKLNNYDNLRIIIWFEYNFDWKYVFCGRNKVFLVLSHGNSFPASVKGTRTQK